MLHHTEMITTTALLLTISLLTEQRDSLMVIKLHKSVRFVRISYLAFILLLPVKYFSQ